jgi:hypothetical protein
VKLKTVDVMVVVTFEKVNVKTKVFTTYGVTLTVVVMVASIGVTAGALAGRRIASPARITQVMTKTLIAACLFKSVLSRCWV